MQWKELERIARQIRLRDLEAVYAAGAGHIGGEMSAIDILTALYFHVLKIYPDNAKHPDRDRFVLSKGHTACALYITLAKRGFFPEDEISTFLQPYSRLNGHPNCNKVPGVETNTGPLGHGLPVAIGIAKAGKLTSAGYHTYVMTGDGEMQEGSNWEAIMAASQFGLDNLTLIIDHNRFQQGAALADTNNVAPLRPKLEAFGWEVSEINGNEMAEIVPALQHRGARPHCIVAHTNKGHGISFMQDRVDWHHKVPNKEQYELAVAELSEAL
ncbi:transketolase [Agrobacterium rhizogenes]|uniref:Transketolase N-terminal subunit protein n=1 Tax=Rhizobium rhizogenes (strain K84 / ATCC BAA-868) TaxID=311403 RepID=B9JHX4_RHIR8|nr:MULTISPECIES: transketolase [Rhizobium]ACM29516.1 transketolase N-terminal subunit protein [Rhizobium rhizogenes K84]KAA6487716.1 transketolase [Agrobacterium sp. ICMP 7243]OCI96211.1 transketolase [Agrobacterium sp. 13-626]OCJ09898.1 transketolase [Agrobacterium sp. B131/95]OCJ22972.1 transketolase [Agrobacterium sp. B133/95]